MTSPILDTAPLGFPWVTADPFLFCVHHDDAYPAGDARMAPKASMAGRDLGQDFTVKDGFRMYHGHVVPGFPQHPHRGFETVTIVRRGLIDHSDSLGATARFGEGDTQWLTAGKGIVHSEMFPLVHEDRPNPLELFQIWLNLPSQDKMAPPHFSMLWSDSTPRVAMTDANGKKSEVMVVAGSFDGKDAPSPPPKSWASRDDSDVAIFCITLEPGATLRLPRAKSDDAHRTLYFFVGDTVTISGVKQVKHAAIAVDPTVDLELVAGTSKVEILMLQGRPIGEPVVAHGPFVMNRPEEIQRAFTDYRATGFGGWPFDRDDPTHARTEGRFAKHADGRIERAE